MCEIGTVKQERGSVIAVKILGALGLIDEGEADWKIIAIDKNDPLATNINELKDLEIHLPGLLDATRDWFRIYKVPDGKPQNNFAANGQYYDRDFSLDLIKHAHEAWLKLSNQTSDDKISLINTSLNNKNTISDNKASEMLKTYAKESLNFINDTDKRQDLEKTDYVNRNKL